MYCGGASCEAVATQLGIGTSTVNVAVKDVSRTVCSFLGDKIAFPSTEDEIASVMRGFSDIRGLPYCVGAVDGTHIKWLACPDQQFYEYRCYKGYPSVVVFAVSTADRRFTFVDIGRPGVLGDSTIYSLSELKRNIDMGHWLGETIPDLSIANVPVRPYLMGDCAFTLDCNMMKSSSQAEMNANPVLRTWDAIASQTRKPIECAFGILKHRFGALRTGIKLLHEDDIVRLLMACVILHNMCTGEDFNEEDFLPQDEEGDSEEATAETSAGKRQRDALLYYVTSNF